MGKILKVFTAFSGYDSQCLALERLKLQHPSFDYELVGWSEIDKYAIQAHNAIFPQYADRNFGDISKIDWSQVPDFDLFTYSSPCQDFSNAGKQMGGEEGSGTRIRPYMDVDDIAIDGRTNLILMDNNILASDYGIAQIEKIIERGYRVDFNQAMDARLVTPEIARLLAKVKWIKRIRFGCDTPVQIEHCERAISLIDAHGYKGEYFFYCILQGSFEESFSRVDHWHKRGGRFLPHAQPYLDFTKRRQSIPQWQKDLAAWANKKWVFRSCEFKGFEPRKGFRCKEYFY